MKRNLIEFVSENLKSCERIYYHNFYVEKNLSDAEVRRIIDNMNRYYNYNADTGVLRIEYSIINRRKNTPDVISSIDIYLGENLTNEEQDKISIDNHFQYDLDTGFFTLIHKLIYK